MRKYVRDQVMELLSTMWEGVKQAKTLAPQAAEGVLRDCYLAVQTIEQTVRLALSEESVPQYTCLLVPLKKLLEEMNSDIAQGISATETAKKIKRHCNQLRKLLREEQEIKLEVVFFPYKASMWDALESIWLAAKDDPQCDAIVVPIPYYDRRPDGSLGEMHYEGEMYPSYVPIVDWQEYDLPARHPDVAFIHNPYDNTNIVTQVHSMYFSDTLKKYVGLLCYSPYFVVLDKLTPHFATLPAVRNADVVIVQSEEIGRQYLQVWEDMFKKKQVGATDVQNMKKKILPLGSPKFDAVARNGRETLELPEDWKRLIVRPDGTRRKVVFYNTSISNMLTYTVDIDGRIDDRYLNKLESVLRYFKRREDAVLLWRPHPLLAQTFASMRAPLYQRYCQIVRDYKREGYGIYDDSDELHRAISVADIYYGDGSSVVTLWKKTGKPLLINNVDITDYQQRLVARNLYFDGECFWCTALDFNGLFRIEKDTLKIHYVGQFPNEKKEGYYLFDRITECDGKLFFSPCSANNIGIYDKETKKFSFIPLKLPKKETDKEKKFADAFTFGKYVFITGNRISSILKIDTQTNAVTVIDNWKERLFSHKNTGAPSLIVYGCKIKEKLYFPSKYANGMFVFDMQDCKTEFYSFNKKNKMYYCGVPTGDKIWICSNIDSSIGRYDILTKKTIDFKNDCNFAGFSDVKTYGDRIYCFSCHHSRILKIDSLTNQMQLFQTKENSDVVEIVDHCAYAISRMSGNMQKINLETMEQWITPMVSPIEMPESKYQNILKESERYNNQHAQETSYLNLDVFVSMVLNSVAKGKNKRNSGETIYQYIKEMMQ